MPGGNIHRSTFNEAHLLESLKVNLSSAKVATSFVDNVDCDAKGQRERIEYGNGAVTSYEHDPLTYQLMRLHSFSFRIRRSVRTSLTPTIPLETLRESRTLLSKPSFKRTG